MASSYLHLGILLGLLALAKGYKRVCYYRGLIPASAFDATICTHINYAFAGMTVDSIGPRNQKDVDNWNDLQAKKKENPNLKILISAGGGGSKVYHETLKTEASQLKFIQQSMVFLRKYNFDGIDIDFEGFLVTEKEAFGKFIERFRNAIDKEDTKGKPKLLLTAAIAATRWGMSLIRMDIMARDLDFINMMSYDWNLYSTVFKWTGHNSPLFPRPDEKDYMRQWNIEWAANFMHSVGVPKEKIIVGLAIYGRSFILADAAKHDVHSPSVGTGTTYAFYTICKFLKNGYQSAFDQYSKVPYAWQGTTWITYDDKQSIYQKVKWIRDIGKFGGAMTWSIDMDDYDGKQCSNSSKFLLHEIIREILP